jgi:hypothetical protein
MLDQQLIAAYSATDYVLFAEPGEEIVLKIGRHNGALDRILEQRGAMAAVIVTAFNPRSVVLPDDENRRRHEQFTAMLEARGLDYALGEGRDPTGQWKAELECVVFGISLEEGLELARAFDQNAIVFVSRGEPPRLAFPD